MHVFRSGCVSVLFCNAVLSVLSCVAIIQPMKTELFALLQLCSCCCMAVISLSFPHGALSLSEIVAFPGHTKHIQIKCVLKVVLSTKQIIFFPFQSKMYRSVS